MAAGGHRTPGGSGPTITRGLACVDTRNVVAFAAMIRLSRSDLEAVLGFAATAAVATASDDERRPWVIEQLAELIPSDSGSYVATDRDAPMQGTTRWWAACSVLWEHALHPVTAGTPPSWAPGLGELHARENPFYHHDRPTTGFAAVRISDITDMATFGRTELASAIGWSDVPYSLQLKVRDESGVSSYVTLDRAARDFSTRDVQVLTLLRPLLLAFETSLSLRLKIEQLVGSSSQDATVERRLTRRERQILDLVATGESNAEIAYRLAISPETVRKHLENVYSKLEVNSRTGALARTGRARSSA
jgi:DNA-binding CsgD family transcriptional regulator